MRWIAEITVAAAMAGVSAQAHAADWWWVAGAPGDNAVVFVDADTVVQDAGTVTFHMQQIDRSGQVNEAVQQMRCVAPSASKEKDAMRRFACATMEERMNFALIIDPMTPQETARMIFALPPPNS